MVLDGAEIDFVKNVVSDALNWPANSTGQTTLLVRARSARPDLSVELPVRYGTASDSTRDSAIQSRV